MVYPNWFVCVMGMGTVFAGLIILIFAVKIMGHIIGNGENHAASGVSSDAAQIGRSLPAAQAVRPSPEAGSGKAGEITPELIAAVSAAIAEDMGLPDVSALRIVSIRRV